MARFTRFSLSIVVLAAAAAGCANTTDPASTTDTPLPTTSQSGREGTLMQIRLRIGDTETTGRLYDNPTARDFASLLPVTIPTHDLGGREIAGTLPRALADGEGQSTYGAGQLGYWAPSRDLAIYYHEDGFRIPSPGIVMIGEVETELDRSIADATTVTITAG